MWQCLSKDLTFAEIAERLDVMISTIHRISQHFTKASTVDLASRKNPRLHTRVLDNNLKSFVVCYVLEVYLCELRQKN